MAEETQMAAGQVLYMVVLSTLGVSFAAWSLHLARARARARRERSSSALAAGKPTTHSSTYLLE